MIDMGMSIIRIQTKNIDASYDIVEDLCKSSSRSILSRPPINGMFAHAPSTVDDKDRLLLHETVTTILNDP